jgi:hypothetical protein
MRTCLVLAASNTGLFVGAVIDRESNGETSPGNTVVQPCINLRGFVRGY